jgi:DUF971 family protein
MMKPPVYPVKLSREGRTSFLLTWNDGAVRRYILADVQRVCPCRMCERKIERFVDPLVVADALVPVGQYGLRFNFSSGCSQGIFPYELLRMLGTPC